MVISSIDCTQFTTRDLMQCKLLPQRIDAYVLQDTRGAFFLDGKDGVIGGADWREAKGFYFDITANATHNARFNMSFRRTGRSLQESADVSCVFGVLPGCRTRIWFDLSWLDGQGVHMPRTPGRLKMGISASTRFTIGEMGSFVLEVWNSPTPFGFVIENFSLADEVPDFPYDKRELVDELGQWIPKSWKGKTPGLDALRAQLTRRLEEARQAPDAYAVEGWSRWGGFLDHKLTEGSGYFATHHDGRRWWMVDPDGYAFISVGPDAIGGEAAGAVDVVRDYLTWLPSRDDPAFAPCWSDKGAATFNYETANLIRTFGEDWFDSYVAILRHDMKRWGFNTLANWTAIPICRAAKMPYCIPMPTYPTTHPTVFRDFPDVFSPEFEENAQSYAHYLTEFADDPYLIGYFMTNEPNWAYIQDLSVAEQVLACPFDLASKDALIAWLKEKYNSIAAFNAAWNLSLSDFSDLYHPLREARKLSAQSQEDLTAFSRIMVRRYTQIPAEACRKVDPHHLNLGMRYAWISSPDLIEGWDCFDVFSINNYRMCPVEEINRVAAMVNKPILVGEFHFGALDVGLPATGLRGVPTQADRATAYRYYVENAAAHPSFVGAHYFTYEDQFCLGRGDGENLNIGCVDICMTPYEDFTQGIHTAHENLYPVALGRIMPSRTAAPEIPMVFS